MITEGKETHLGKRAFIILCLEKSKIPGTILLITVLVALVQDMLPAIVQPFVSTATFYLTILTIIVFAIVFLMGLCISYRQIQNVNIERNPTYQILGLSKLVLETAGREDKGEEGTSEVVLEAVDKKLAEEMRDKIIKKIGVQIVRPETPNA
jgi:uncharacterized membrane protein YdbT with pleckstrin-like domain